MVFLCVEKNNNLIYKVSIMKKIATLVSALFLATGLSAKVVYVATDGNNSNDGSSWEKAVADIQTAYKLASAGDDIWMAGGTYVLTDGSALLVDMKDEVDVYGSFAKGDASVDARVRKDAAKPYEFANPTVFTSEGAVLKQRPFGRSNVNDIWKGATIDGLKFADIATENGKLLFLQTGVTMQNCVVINCGGTDIIVYFEGNGLMKDCLVEGCYKNGGKQERVAAVRVCASKTFQVGNKVDNVTFRGNKATSSCLHIYNYEEANDKTIVTNCTFDGNENACLVFRNPGLSTPILVDGCLFENNKGTTAASTTGVGVVTEGSSGSVVVLNNCIIRNNENLAAADTDVKNAVVAMNGGWCRLSNSLIVNNKSNRACVYWGGHMVNCTLVDNIGSVIAATKSNGSYINNIFVNNTATAENTIFTADSESPVEFYCNAIDEADVTATNAEVFVDRFVAGVDHTSFVNAAAGDYGLADNSPCINAGVWNHEDFGIDAYPSTLVGYAGEGKPEFQDAVDAYSKDLAGNARVVDGQISLGAYQGKASSAIAQVGATEKALVYGAECAVVVEVAAQAQVAVYTLTGSLVKTVVLNAGINTVPMASGLYLVQLNGVAYKAIVK